MLGLETALGLTISELVGPGHLSLSRAVELLSTAPARILGMNGQGSIGEGRPANLVVFDPAARWTVEPERLQSLSRNTPFAGRELTGTVVHTFFRGRQTVRDGAVQEGARV
jgi:dihydroorotase